MILSVAVLALASIQACDAADFGPLNQDPLVITGSWQVGDGCFLDFGARAIEIDGTLNVSNVRLRAASITVTDRGKILGDRQRVSTTTLETFRAGGHDGGLTVLGRIEQNANAGGGTVLIDVDGEFWIGGGGQVEARGTAADADGGYVEILARDRLEVDGSVTSIDVSGGGRDASGGAVYLESLRDDVFVRRGVDAHGQQGGGGEMEMLAYAGSVTTEATLDLHGIGYGDGGDLTIAARVLIRCGGLVNADAGGGTLAYGGGTGGVITLECDREVELLDRIHAQGGIDSDGGEVEVSCRDFLFSGSAVQLQSTGYGGSGGIFAVDARGDVLISGRIDVDADDLGLGGDVEVSAGGSLEFSGEISARGGSGGDVALNCEVWATVSGTLDANGKGADGSGGGIAIVAGGDLDLSDAVLEADGSSATGTGGSIVVRAGPILIADSRTRLRARGNSANGGDPGTVLVAGCRIEFPAGSQISADGAQPGGSVTMVAADVLTLGGSVRADQGAVHLTTRLDAPWSPLMVGASIVPPPVVVHDRVLSPCLATDSTVLTGSSTVRAGESFTLTLRSTPHRKIVVSVDFLPTYASMGALGWQALSPTTAYFAADFGRFGPPRPGSRTDAQGAWTWTSPAIPAPFVGRTLHAEAFVVDPSARNGVFHQTGLWTVPVLP